MGYLLDNRLRDRAILLPFALFALNQLLRPHLPSSPFLDGWLNDLTAMPILLFLGMELRNLIIQNPKPLNNANILYTFVLLSIYFEIYLPTKSTAYTADMWDTVMYGIGMFYFTIFMNGSRQKA